MTAHPIVLASRSPRRRQLLEMLGLPVIVAAADVQEIRLPRESPSAYARRLARDKARAVPGALVLGADTIVVVDDDVLEKPEDAEHALAMLRRLQGRRHDVVTSVCLIAGGTVQEAQDVTAVYFRPADDAMLRAYIATGEPMDKAGAYGIQGYGAALVERIEGDFFSVMGLPVRLVLDLLARAGTPYVFPAPDLKNLPYPAIG
jgi:septum formation protein